MDPKCLLDPRPSPPSKVPSGPKWRFGNQRDLPRQPKHCWRIGFSRWCPKPEKLAKGGGGGVP